MRSQRIALMGAGSLGTILGAYIAKGGEQIDLIDVDQAHVEALDRDGAKVVGTVALTVPVHAITPAQMEGEYDLFLYMTKQTYNDTAIPQMAAHLAPEGYICVFQNGIPEDAVAQVIGADHTLGATVGWGATWVGPGVSEATTTPAGAHVPRPYRDEMDDRPLAEDGGEHGHERDVRRIGLHLWRGAG